jgi:hypothetical protein
MKDNEIIKGRIAQAYTDATIHFESPKELFEFSKKLYNGMLEIPVEKLKEMDKYAIAWLEQTLMESERQLDKTGGLQAGLIKHLIFTLKIQAGVFFEHKTIVGNKLLIELSQHIKQCSES